MPWNPDNFLQRCASEGHFEDLLRLSCPSEPARTAPDRFRFREAVARAYNQLRFACIESAGDARQMEKARRNYCCRLAEFVNTALIPDLPGQKPCAYNRANNIMRLVGLEAVTNPYTPRQLQDAFYLYARPDAPIAELANFLFTKWA